MKTDDLSHDWGYQKYKAEGRFGWTSEADHIQTLRPRILNLIQTLAIPQGSRLLELGCGTGDLAIFLAQQGFAAYGIDIAPTAIAWATEKATQQATTVNFTIGNVLDLSAYSDQFFQLVIDGLCLHCIIGSDRQRCLANIYRILEPGGCFFVQTMCGEVNDNQTTHHHFDPISRCLVNPEGIAIRYIGMPDAIVSEMSAVGFQIQQVAIVPRETAAAQDDLLVQAIRPRIE